MKECLLYPFTVTQLGLRRHPSCTKGKVSAKPIISVTRSSIWQAHQSSPVGKEMGGNKNTKLQHPACCPLHSLTAASTYIQPWWDTRVPANHCIPRNVRNIHVTKMWGEELEKPGEKKQDLQMKTPLQSNWKSFPRKGRKIASSNQLEVPSFRSPTQFFNCTNKAAEWKNSS